MRSYDRLQIVILEKLLRHLRSKEVGAASGSVKSHDLSLFAVIAVDRISPHQIAISAQFRDLNEAVYL